MSVQQAGTGIGALRELEEFPLVEALLGAPLAALRARRRGVFEAYCPLHYPDMAAAVEAFAGRKFGPGGTFPPGTPGA